MSERILVWGAGAIGGTVGAVLAEAGQEVTFVDILPEHVAKIRAAGLTITGPVRAFTVAAPAFGPGEIEGRWSRIYLAVKGQHTEAAVRTLAPHLADDGYVLSLQNGLCERIIAGIVGRDRTMGGIVNFGADWIGPGEIHWGNRAAVAVGELDGRFTERARALLETIRIFAPEAILTDDIGSYLWGKLAYGSLLFAQGICESGIADTLERPELLPLWRYLAGEVVDIARSERVEPRGFNGFDPAAFGRRGSEAAARASVEAMAAFNRPNAKTHSGVWRDLSIRKRRTEVDASLGPVAEIGRARGIACRKLDALIAMIHEIEEGRRTNSDRNLDELLAS